MTKAKRLTEVAAFTYDDGVVRATEGDWKYSIKDAALKQLELQSNYRTLTAPWIGNENVSMCSYYIANMAVGLADGNYRRQLEVGDVDGKPVMSAFAVWVEDYRALIYSDVQAWTA